MRLNDLAILRLITLSFPFFSADVRRNTVGISICSTDFKNRPHSDINLVELSNIYLSVHQFMTLLAPHSCIKFYFISMYRYLDIHATVQADVSCERIESVHVDQYGQKSWVLILINSVKLCSDLIDKLLVFMDCPSAGINHIRHTVCKYLNAMTCRNAMVSINTNSETLNWKKNKLEIINIISLDSNLNLFCKTYKCDGYDYIRETFLIE